MRFFSNDAKETNDDVPSHPDADAPAVPQQRIGSPWSAAPADNPSDSVASDHSTETEEPDDVRGLDDRVDNEPADTQIDEPERAQDDFGAAEPTQDDQVDLSLDEHNTANHSRDEDDASSPDPETSDASDASDASDPEISEPDAAASETDTETDEPVAEASETDTAITEPEAEAAEPDAAIAEPDADTPEADADDNAAAAELDERAPAADLAVDDQTDAETSDADPTDGDVETTGTEADAPVAATPVEFGDDSTTYASAAAETSTDDSVPVESADSTPVVAAVPVAAAALSTPAEAEAGKPGSVAEKRVESLFGEEAAKGFQERWRDVQLRFVDSPKDAAAEAAALVDEAVDQLTANLKAQKDTLLSDTDDTEKLRLELRGYRDILNKVVSL